MKSRVSHDLVSQNIPNITGFTVISDNCQCCRGTLASDLMQYIGLFLPSLCCFNFFPGGTENSKGRHGSGSWFGFGSTVACGERHWQKWVVRLKGWNRQKVRENRKEKYYWWWKKNDSPFYVFLHCREPPQTGSLCFSFPLYGFSW